MNYIVMFTGGFRDGNVYPEFIPPGRKVEVDEVTYRKMKQSDPDVIVIEKVVPKSSVMDRVRGK